MGINLRWEDEHGKQLAELLDRHYLVRHFLPAFKAQDFPCLGYVDPAGDTTFNQCQIAQLISELEKLSEQQHEPDVGQHLLRVLEFARQARNKVHTYLKFYGD